MTGWMMEVDSARLKTSYGVIAVWIHAPLAQLDRASVYGTEG